MIKMRISHVYESSPSYYQTYKSAHETMTTTWQSLWCSSRDKKFHLCALTRTTGGSRKETRFHMFAYMDSFLSFLLPLEFLFWFLLFIHRQPMLFLKHLMFSPFTFLFLFFCVWFLGFGHCDVLPSIKVFIFSVRSREFRFLVGWFVSGRRK
jgi:hypothetical protein